MAPLLMRRQRGAATPQPRGAVGSGPKGVVPTAFTEALRALSAESPRTWGLASDWTMPWEMTRAGVGAMATTPRQWSTGEQGALQLARKLRKGHPRIESWTASTHQGRIPIVTFALKACTSLIASTRGIRNGSSQRTYLAGILGGKGILGNKGYLSIGGCVATSVKRTAADGRMHRVPAKHPVEFASVRMAAPVGMGPTMAPRFRVGVVITRSTLVVIVQVGGLRGLLGAPSRPPTRFFLQLHRGASHLAHLASLGYLPEEAAMLAHIGTASAVIMNKGLLDGRTATGSCPGKGHPRGYTCHTSSTPTVQPRDSMSRRTWRTSALRRMIEPASARRTGRAMMQLGMMTTAFLHEAMPPRQFGGGRPRLGSAVANGRAARNSGAISAMSAAVKFVGLAMGLGPLLQTGGGELRRGSLRRTRTSGARLRIMPRGSRSARRRLRKAWTLPAGPSSRRRSASLR